MDEQTRQNWIKIKEVLEETGKTDSMFYRRACSIIKSGVDPMEHVFNQKS